MNFADPVLVEKYGSWVRVQVAFYDFLFERGSELCAMHFRESAVESVVNGDWAEGNEFYESIIGKLEELFDSAEEAWQEFCSA